ncbi:hypothetical protein K469DRAFT_715133 [Zopfia rhizophila CBS 207.26]|uniref:AAA+ ATPase domain-containing protein n=1 Tax=Zopfia rhizophila CBS 207.26 TaxID=1314779 RepID=A0A6A6ELP8_9PEZI|nr:hypothetical protein K469DRAFT_715133 [Zopfia rhizophila CBS 207.26]
MNKQPLGNPTSNTHASLFTAPSPAEEHSSDTNTVVLAPASTSSSSPSTPQVSTPSSHQSTTALNLDNISGIDTEITMDTARENKSGGDSVGTDALKSQQERPASTLDVVNDTAKTELDPSQTQLAQQKKKKKQPQCSRHGKKNDKRCSTKKASKKGKEENSSEDSSSEETSESESSDSSDSSDSDSEDEREKRKKKKKALKKREKKKVKARKRKSKKKYDFSSDESSSGSDSDSESDSEEEKRPRKRKSKKSKKAEESSEEEEEGTTDAMPETSTDEDLETKLRNQLAQLQMAKIAQQAGLATSSTPGQTMKKSKSRKKAKKAGKRASTLEFKRVDQLWDTNIHNFKLTESTEEKVDEYDQYVFTVRRKFDYDNKYRKTVVDVKSKLLRDALQEVMKDVKSVSLVEETPSVDPNMLFLYLEELKIHFRKTLKAQLRKEKKKKQKKRISLQIAHCKLLACYLDEDYEETKKTLYPMLKAGNITFDLLWALFKPNTIAFTPTYGSNDDPRCFKVDYATKESNLLRGEWYCIEGRYLEYDGKIFGLGDFEVHVEAFKGPRKITSLATYPLQYHNDPEGVKKQLIERGKKFVALQGMNYRFHKGLAFLKKKKAIAKVNINGRVMVDPAIFRRVNPNYPISYLKRKEDEDPFNSKEDSDDECSCCGGSDSESEGLVEGVEGPLNYGEQNSDSERTRIKVFVDRNDKVQVVHVPVDENGNEIVTENLDSMELQDGSANTFTEEELLIASPVVLGFAFSEKLWLEFSLSGIKEIEWNDEAFSSLVLPHHIKQNLRGLVSSHKFHAAKTIDDVVQGKGRGLNVVLHGPPGVGKTLTAEGIAEYLKCPLYAVSAGELGTDSRMLEGELNKIMDVAHSWGAVLLLDEADVFLERREVHDIHRNALVSIFLRLLEYYQGILFLTTNRVETFDEAFQSRIHMGIKYENLTRNARKEVWQQFVGKVRRVEGQDIVEFKDSDFVELSKKVLNGRQIKNAVKVAQSIALSEETPFSMKHIARVLDVAEDFDADLKGGNGYRDAMRQYT